VGTPAGGSYSTARDLWSFARALASGRLISAGLLSELTRPRSYPAGTVPYGAGFEVDLKGDGWSWFGHTGGFAGVSAALRIYSERGYVVVVLANVNQAAPAVADWIERALPAQ